MSMQDHIIPPGPLERIAALIDRERKTRFSGGLLGYCWAYVTPLVWIGLIVFLFWYLDATPPIDADVEIFLATGVLTYVIFRQTVTALSRMMDAHRYMRYFRGVSSNELLWASMLLEGFHFLVTSLAIFGILTFLTGADLPHSMPTVLFGLMLTWMIGCGVGRFVAIGSQLSDTFARSVPLLLRPFFWVSGIFYIAAELPVWAQQALWYSPFLHVTEIMRTGYFLGFESHFADAWYPIFIASAFYLASLPLEAYARQNRILRARL